VQGRSSRLEIIDEQALEGLSPMSMPAKLRGEFYAAVEHSDLAGMVSCYRPDAVLVQPDGRFEGQEQIEAYYRAQLAMFSGLRFTVRATHRTADTDVAEWSFSATNTGPIEAPGGEPLPATGADVSVRGADVLVAADGLIREHRFYYDQVELMGQLGLLPDGEE
jgi:ketosteroid isomerase-like protein